LSQGVGPNIIKNVIIAFFNLVLKFLHLGAYGLLHSPITEACDSHKVHWDNRKQAVKQIFTTINLVQNIVTYMHLLQSDWRSHVQDQPSPM